MIIKIKPVAIRIAHVLAITAVCLSGCGKKSGAARERPPSPVRVAVAEQVTVPVLSDSFGRLRALNDVDIQAQVSGKIVEVLFEEGAFVEKGQALFRIESDVYQAAVNQAVAVVAGAKADLKQKQATFERNRSLLEQALISQEDYDQLETAVSAAQATLEQAEAALVKAKIDLDYCTVVSPVAGVAGKRLVDAGNIVSASAGKILVNIRTIKPMYLDFTLSESLFPDLRKAMNDGPVEVMVIAESAKGEAGLYSGQLDSFDNTIDPASGTISLRAVVSNSKSKLWPGQFVYAFPALGVISNAIIVPQSAVTKGQSGDYAYVISNNTAEVRMVKKGPAVGDALVALSGINKGDVVVTVGHLGVWPGAKVEVLAQTPAEMQAMIDKRAADPNNRLLVRVLAARGDTPEQISVLTGLPVEKINNIIGGATSESRQ